MLYITLILLYLPTGLYALVNNAGIWQPGEIEWASIAAYRRVMEVNTFGTVRVTKAFLPLIRRAKGVILLVLIHWPFVKIGPHVLQSFGFF